MKNIPKSKSVAAALLAGTVLFSSCVSSTVIQSVPSAAKVYIDGEPKGTTPYNHSDTKIIGSITSVRLEREGFEPFSTSFSRTEEPDIGAIIGGAFVWFPFLWAMKYKPMRIYELNPKTEASPGQQTLTLPQARSKAERLREIKKLLDEKILTQAEYEKEKKKILDE